MREVLREVGGFLREAGLVTHNFLTGWADRHPRRAANIIFVLILILLFVVSASGCTTLAKTETFAACHEAARGEEFPTWES